MLGHIAAMQGELAGVEKLERAVELEAALASLPLHFRPSFLLGITLLYLSELDRARPLLQAQVERANEAGDEVMRGVALSTLAELELRSGRWAQAHRCAAEGASLQEQAAPLQDQAHHVLRVARVAAHMGRIEEARPVATRLLELAPTNGDRSAEIAARRDLGFMELSLGNAAATVALLEPAAALLAAMGVGLFSAFPFVQDYVEALVVVGDLDRAERANAVLDASTRPWEQAMRARGRALIAAARGDYSAAQEEIGRALVAHERLSEPFELARTLLVQGSLERRGKQRAAAKRTLTEALERFDALGAPIWAERTASELARIPGRPRGSGELTETERRVAELVTEGLSNKEVAARLFVTVRTVEANLSKIYAKLGIRSRTELARRL
jgi:DNA-binding CsgD family transcriptional regulator/tetratricopeptide (TPR) repeat protein